MFLNAGDFLTGEGLSECVEPIVQGRYETAGAPVVHSSAPEKKPDHPVFEHIYLGAQVCHQGYFAATELYRRLGGYDAATYRCMADADFISRAYAATGEPYVSRMRESQMLLMRAAVSSLEPSSTRMSSQCSTRYCRTERMARSMVLAAL